MNNIIITYFTKKYLNTTLIISYFIKINILFKFPNPNSSISYTYYLDCFNIAVNSQQDRNKIAEYKYANIVADHGWLSLMPLYTTRHFAGVQRVMRPAKEGRQRPEESHHAAYQHNCARAFERWPHIQRVFNNEVPQPDPESCFLF